MQLTKQQIWDALVKKYGDELPDPEHCPKQFKYLVKLYLFQQSLQQGKENG